jgi:hypothetical protein
VGVFVPGWMVPHWVLLILQTPRSGGTL